MVFFSFQKKSNKNERQDKKGCAEHHTNKGVGGQGV